jgi:hypothetical protein
VRHPGNKPKGADFASWENGGVFGTCSRIVKERLVEAIETLLRAHF